MRQSPRAQRAVLAIACSISLMLAGCASSSREVSATYVSPITYRSYDCEQISAETMRIQSRVQQLGARLDEASSNDKKLVGVGMLLFWPALFALGGTKEQEAEYARLKGEYDALQQAYIEKKCGSSVVKPAAPVAPVAPVAAVPPTAPASASNP